MGCGRHKWFGPHHTHKPLCPTSKGPHFIPPLSVPLRVPGRIPYTRLHTHKIFRPRVDPSPPHKIFSRGGDGGCDKGLGLGNKVPRPFQPRPVPLGRAHTHAQLGIAQLASDLGPSLSCKRVKIWVGSWWGWYRGAWSWRYVGKGYKRPRRL